LHILHILHHLQQIMLYTPCRTVCMEFAFSTRPAMAIHRGTLA